MHGPGCRGPGGPGGLLGAAAVTARSGKTGGEVEGATAHCGGDCASIEKSQ